MSVMTDGTEPNDGKPRAVLVASALATLLAGDNGEQGVDVTRDEELESEEGPEAVMVTVSALGWEVIIHADGSGDGDEVRIAAPDRVSEELIPDRLGPMDEALLIHAIGLGLWDTENDGYDSAGKSPRYGDPAERFLDGNAA